MTLDTWASNQEVSQLSHMLLVEKDWAQNASEQLTIQKTEWDIIL